MRIFLLTTGKEVTDFSRFYSFEQRDLIIGDFQDDETGFVIREASKLEPPSGHRYKVDTNCSDKSNEYIVSGTELLSCASGRIKFADGPFCLGDPIRFED